MDEVEIWMQVLKELNWTFIDEETGIVYNKLIYWKEGQYLNLYFNYKTSDVSSLNIKRTSYDQSDKININKDIFYNLHIDLFREVKISYITNQ